MDKLGGRETEVRLESASRTDNPGDKFMHRRMLKANEIREGSVSKEGS
jgi:hypothetical protein